MRDLIIWAVLITSNVASFIIGQALHTPLVVYPKVQPGVSFTTPENLLLCPRTQKSMEIWDSVCNARARDARIRSGRG